ncbi:MAG: IPT/TIG domain-containing protein [Planctomycetota bacterium]
MLLNGVHFAPDMRIFFGRNNLMYEDNVANVSSLSLPLGPISLTDKNGDLVALEVETTYEYLGGSSLLVRIPPAVSCTLEYSNPYLRMTSGRNGSSDAVDNIFRIIGPRFIALTPNDGLDIGGYTVIVHGDFFSPYTQIVLRFINPLTDEGEWVGAPLDAAKDIAEQFKFPPPERVTTTDIDEQFVDRHTLIISNWPSVVESVEGMTAGLTDELIADIFLIENIEEITSNAANEPLLEEDGFGRRGACQQLTDTNGDGQQDATSGVGPAHGGTDAAHPRGEVEGRAIYSELSFNGVRNSVRLGAFTFLPSGVVDIPEIVSIVPDRGSESGDNMVILNGFQFDAFSVDISDENALGVAIECPPGSGDFIAPLEATLIDRQTIILRMPPCDVEVPEAVNVCITNKFVLDRLDKSDPPDPAQSAINIAAESVNPLSNNLIDQDPQTYPNLLNNRHLDYDDVYTYEPIPPIVPPILTAIHPSSGQPQPQGRSADYGCERLFMVGDWFDADTTLNGGVEFLLNDGTVVQTQRTILHNRNLIEVFTKQLPGPPLTQDIIAGVRLRNTVGHSDYDNAMVFFHTPDAGERPFLTEVFRGAGPSFGGNAVQIHGTNFDTSSIVRFGGFAATTFFVNSNFLIAIAPDGEEVFQFLGGTQTEGQVGVFVDDDGDNSNSIPYIYGLPADTCPAIGVNTPDSGSHIGGYWIQIFGTDLTPTTRVEFGVGNGNFAPDIFFISDTCILVEVPEAFPEQIGATVMVGLTDPINECDEALRTAPFTYTAAQQNPPTIEFVDSTVEVPVTQTPHPAINVRGGADRLLVIGSGFDQMTTFDITKGDADPEPTTDWVVLTPNLAVMTAPESPDGEIGEALLTARNDFGASEVPFTVEYVQTPPPVIVDVRNLHDGTTGAPIDANDRILIFGDYFVKPNLVVTLRQGTQEVSFTDNELVLIDDHMIGVNIPADTFTEGPLEILVQTDFSPGGVPTAFVDDGDQPIFTLSGPRPPLVTGVHATIFHSHGGQDAVLFGRNFTPSTRFRVKTLAMPSFVTVLAQSVISETVAIVVMPQFAFAGDGTVEATETDTILCDKLTTAGQPCVTVSSDDPPLYQVLADAAPVLIGVFADHGSTAGGEQVLLLGADFKNEVGESNVTGVSIGAFSFTEADPLELPIDSLNPADYGKYVVINGHQIMLITPVHAAIPGGSFVQEDVTIDYDIGDGSGATMLTNGYTWQNQTSEICPKLLGITPNEGRISGGSSHLISGAFLDSATKIILSDGVHPDVDITTFGQVETETGFGMFLVFILPDLTGDFSVGDTLDVTVVKTTVDGECSDTLNDALTLTFAGLPFTATLTPPTGSAFGGTLVTVTGTKFTPNTQVLFGTMPAGHVVYVSSTLLYAVSPALPLDVNRPEALDLLNVGSKTPAERTVDVVVYTQGGWSIMPQSFRFDVEAPTVSALTVTSVLEGSSTDAITLFGDRFLPGDTTLNVTATGTAGTPTIINITGDSITFRYDAPTRLAGTPGPVEISFSVTTSHGGPSSAVTLDVELNPHITSIARQGGGSLSVPSTGVETGGFPIFEATGFNFAAGASMTTITKGGDTINLTENPALDGPGQFKIVSATTIEFTVPVAFDQNIPTILTGNPNIGLTTMDFQNANGLGIDGPASSFIYSPSHLDFEQEAFSLPAEAPNNSNPDKVAVGDIDADGVPDAACLNRVISSGDTIDGFVFLANTFGTFDFNGDGVTPDFEGSFNIFIINDEDHKPELGSYGRGGTIRLAQLDGDDQMELVLPVITVDDTLDNRARVLVVDMDTDGTILDTAILVPDVDDSKAVAGIATGTFDNTNSRDDIAIIIGSPTSADRDLIVFTSEVGTTFGDFAQFTVQLTGSLDNASVGHLAAGDFDNDDDDDLVWGYGGSLFQSTLPIAVVKVDADSSPSVVAADIKTLDNIKGGSIRDIKVARLDKDQGDDEDLKWDIVLIAENGVTGDLVGPDGAEGSIIVVLNVFDDATPIADAFYETGFDNNGRSLGVGDINAEGPMDVAVADNDGEFLIFWNDGNGVFERSGKSFQLNTVADDGSSRIHGISVADINRDGMAEVWMGDIGSAPTSLVIMTNISR